jgi:hypothetical protein
MREKPIFFSAPMVRALLDGSKTQTRRVFNSGVPLTIDGVLANKCPYGQVGDQLWVRETFCDVYGSGGNEHRRKKEVMYRADGETDPNVVPRWTPSLHMPRWASRITLEITSVRVERLHDLSAADALAEGIIQLPDGGYSVADTRHYSDSPDESYASLWESINGAGSWDLNPYVWVIGFKKAQST